MTNIKSKPIALIITLGARDMHIDRAKLEQVVGASNAVSAFDDRDNFLPRPGGELIEQHYTKLKKDIRFPIVESFLTWLDHERLIDRVTHIALVATDQPEHLPDRFRHRDTILTAKLLERYLTSRFKAIESKNIRISKIGGDYEITVLDHVYPRFNKIMKSNPYCEFQQPDYQVYLLNQGGIDSITQALMLHCINAYGDQLHLMAVDEKGGTARKLTFPSLFLKERASRQAKEYTKLHNYAAITELNVEEEVKHIARYAERRLSFDFEGAKHEAGQVENNRHRSELLEALNEIQSSDFQKTREVYRNAKIKYLQRNYVDFLFRIFRIVEGTVQQKALGNLSGFTFNINNWSKGINDYLAQENQQELQFFLENYKLGNNSLDLSRPSIPVWLAIWEFFDAEAVILWRNLRRLANLRNLSIGAHSFNPVSKRLLDAELSEIDLNEEKLFDHLDHFFEIHKDEQSFDRVQDILIDSLPS